MISYSSSAGARWGQPFPVGPPTTAGDTVIAGVAGGKALLAYTSNSAAGAHEYVVPLANSQLASAG